MSMTCRLIWQILDMCVSCDTRRGDFPGVDGLSMDPQVLGRHKLLLLLKGFHLFYILYIEHKNTYHKRSNLKSIYTMHMYLFPTSLIPLNLLPENSKTKTY